MEAQGHGLVCCNKLDDFFPFKVLVIIFVICSKVEPGYKTRIHSYIVTALQSVQLKYILIMDLLKYRMLPQPKLRHLVWP